MRRLAVIGAALVVLSGGPAARAGDAEALDRLVAAYPDELARHDASYVYWRDGTAMAVSDGVSGKTLHDLLVNASILDQFRLRYPPGPQRGPPPVDFDPGRSRNEVFFRKMYGDCRTAPPHLAPVVWLPHSWGRTIWATPVNGVAEKLTAISAEIERLPPAVRRAAYPIGGVYSCRPVADTGRASMHAYAAAIDLNPAVADYWLWQHRRDGTAIRYRNRMPQEIVDAFERHGFIWGGKWYHYDTMHFEYRPELLRPAP